MIGRGGKYGGRICFSIGSLVTTALCTAKKRLKVASAISMLRHPFSRCAAAIVTYRWNKMEGAHNLSIHKSFQPGKPKSHLHCKNITNTRNKRYSTIKLPSPNSPPKQKGPLKEFPYLPTVLICFVSRSAGESAKTDTIQQPHNRYIAHDPTVERERHVL